jgi:hypothetical protein
MGGGRTILTFTSALVIAGIETPIANAKSNVPKNNFLILLPPIQITFCHSLVSRSLGQELLFNQ